MYIGKNHELSYVLLIYQDTILRYDLVHGNTLINMLQISITSSKSANRFLKVHFVQKMLI